LIRAGFLHTNRKNKTESGHEHDHIDLLGQTSSSQINKERERERERERLGLLGFYKQSINYPWNQLFASPSSSREPSLPSARCRLPLFSSSGETGTGE